MGWRREYDGQEAISTMEPFSILMLCFAAALLLYAGLLALTKDYKLIPRSYAVKVKDKRAYVLNFAKVIALTAVPPFHCAIAALFNGALAVSVLLVEMVLALWIGTVIMKHTDPEKKIRDGGSER